MADKQGKKRPVRDLSEDEAVVLIRDLVNAWDSYTWSQANEVAGENLSPYDECPLTTEKTERAAYRAAAKLLQAITRRKLSQPIDDLLFPERLR